MPKNINQIIQKLENLKRTINPILANEALVFFQDNFRRQGFLDKSLENWKARKPSASRNKGRGILIDSGALRNSLRVVKVNNKSFVIGTNIKYAAIHNQGGKIDARVSVKGHTRRGRTGRQKVKAHNRKMNLTIPQRKFLGSSYTLRKELEKLFIEEIQDCFK
ncbi:phage virion morphogenesis protein [Bernardetia sp. Wsw4-3y2]|uniref:phage virion morphogenesis protein n=1 Tax=Bernardetia sp. Wsw4-3y2 TaxID=3127471 RepID=UPI0030D19686